VKVEVPQFLKLVEQANSALFFDLETQGLHADYGKILVYSRMWVNDKAPTTTLRENNILRAMRSDFDRADLIVGYNSRLFDVQFANTRLLERGLEPLPQRHHLDMYFALKGKLRTNSKSMGAVGSLLGLNESKLALRPQEWRNVNYDALTKRCESDVKLLLDVYKATKHLVKTINT